MYKAGPKPKGLQLVKGANGRHREKPLTIAALNRLLARTPIPVYPVITQSGYRKTLPTPE